MRRILLCMNKKITTIDDLAVMIGKESRANEKRFSALEEKIDNVIVEVKGIKVEIKEIRNDIKVMQGDIKTMQGDIKIMRGYKRRILKRCKAISKIYAVK